MTHIRNLQELLRYPQFRDNLYHLAIRREEFWQNGTQFIVGHSNSQFFLQRVSSTFAAPTVLNLSADYQIIKYENSDQSDRAIGMLAELILKFK